MAGLAFGTKIACRYVGHDELYDYQEKGWQIASLMLHSHHSRRCLIMSKQLGQSSQYQPDDEPAKDQ